MDLQPRIELLTPKKLIGKRQTMSLADNQTGSLWKSFMVRRKEIKNTLSNHLFSIQVYPASFDFSFSNPHAEFEKWAAIEVADFNTVPPEMETLILPGGLYVVFQYKGLSTDPAIFEYIYESWLPNSIEYELDSRPHFEILGEKYKNNDPDSEEEIWIPVQKKLHT
jgi:AraC family transcriptional regulator